MYTNLCPYRRKLKNILKDLQNKMKIEVNQYK